MCLYIIGATTTKKRRRGRRAAVAAAAAATAAIHIRALSCLHVGRWGRAIDRADRTSLLVL